MRENIIKIINKGFKPKPVIPPVKPIEDFEDFSATSTLLMNNSTDYLYLTDDNVTLDFTIQGVPDKYRDKIKSIKSTLYQKTDEVGYEEVEVQNHLGRLGTAFQTNYDKLKHRTNYHNSYTYKVITEIIFENEGKIFTKNIESTEAIIVLYQKAEFDLRVVIKQNGLPDNGGESNIVRPEGDFSIYYSVTDRVYFQIDAIEKIEFIPLKYEEEYFNESHPNPSEVATENTDYKTTNGASFNNGILTSIEHTFNYNRENLRNRLLTFIYEAKVYYKYNYLKNGQEYQSFKSNILQVATENNLSVTPDQNETVNIQTLKGECGYNVYAQVFSPAEVLEYYYEVETPTGIVKTPKQQIGGMFTDLGYRIGYVTKSDFASYVSPLPPELKVNVVVKALKEYKKELTLICDQ